MERSDIYNVLIKDRHGDPEIHNFTDKDAAIAFARTEACESCRFLEDYKETEYDDEDPSNWILLIVYSCEDDYVRVSKGEVK